MTPFYFDALHLSLLQFLSSWLLLLILVVDVQTFLRSALKFLAIKLLELLSCVLIDGVHHIQNLKKQGCLYKTHLNSEFLLPIKDCSTEMIYFLPTSDIDLPKTPRCPSCARSPRRVRKKRLQCSHQWYRKCRSGPPEIRNDLERQVSKTWSFAKNRSVSQVKTSLYTNSFCSPFFGTCSFSPILVLHSVDIFLQADLFIARLRGVKSEELGDLGAIGGVFMYTKLQALAEGLIEPRKKNGGIENDEDLYMTDLFLGKRKDSEQVSTSQELRNFL